MKKFFPHLTALVVFLALTFAYLSPSLQSKIIYGHDSQSYVGASHQAITYSQTQDEQALWTDAMFGGMPTFQICMTQPASVLTYLDKVLRALPAPSFQLFLYLLGFYIMLLAFRVNPWIAIGGSIAFAFGSYNLIIIVAGHNTKAIAIAYMAPIIGSIYLAFSQKKRTFLAATLLALFLGMSLFANHVQITYYTLIMVLCFGVSELYFHFKERQLPQLLKTIGVLLLSVIIALGLNATRLMTTADYVKTTMRGESNGLTVEGGDQDGLSKDYITNWSYGIGETLTLLIPDFRGGASGGKLLQDSKTAEYFANSGYKKLDRELSDREKSRIDRLLQTNPQAFKPANLAELMYYYQLPLYWGNQPFTSGPVYVGAIVCFLFFLGLFIVPARQRWWLLAATIVGIVLSWGKNFMPLTDFFIDYVPMYNKFRTVSMTLVITCLSMSLLAILALKAFLEEGLTKQQKLKALYISFAVVGGICLLFGAMPFLAGDFVSARDISFSGDMAFLKNTLPQDRADLLSADAFRSFRFILFTFILLWSYLRFNKLKMSYVAFIMAVLFTADMLPIAHRYLNDSHFVDASSYGVMEPSNADKLILQDKAASYRVLDISVDPFNSANPSYFHKTIGGYHAAKLRRYQEVIDAHLSKEIYSMKRQLSTLRSVEDANALFASLPVLNMLNMKYLVYHPDAPPLLNTQACGNAWLLSSYQLADNADQEIAALGKVDLKQQLIVDKANAGFLASSYVPDASARISLTAYAPNEVSYKFTSKEDQIAVFSEIYYPEGWEAYIDGVSVPYFRANYLLRALSVPAGDHEISFIFMPSSYRLGNIFAIISSVLLTLAFSCITFANLTKKKKADE